MCEKMGILTYFSLLVVSACADELLFVNILYRHGDRTPVKPYPTDPYRNISYWPVGFGQLTNKGKMQQYELGQWLRKRYSNFLPEKYSANDIYVRSTDVDRTLMSAEANLAGLYSPVNTDIWDPEIKWQPIPIHTVEEDTDAVLKAKKPCPDYDNALDKLLAGEKFQNIQDQLQPLYEYVSNKSGKHIDSLQELEYLYNTLFIEELNNFTLPSWTNIIYPTKLLPWAHLSFEIYCYTPALQRLKVGLLLNEIFSRIVNKTKGVLDPDRKMWVYSAHDTTIANVLMGLGAFEPHCPPYTSTIILELWQANTKGYYISAFYKNDTNARPISILNCTHKCPLNEVLSLLDPIMLTQEKWDKECVANATAVFWLFAIGTPFAFIVLILGCLLNSSRGRNDYQSLFNQM